MEKFSSIKEIWYQIESWLEANTPWIHASLAPAASEEELAATEAMLGYGLPDDVRESYGIHNGQKRHRPFIDKKGAGFVYGDRLQNLEWMRSHFNWNPSDNGVDVFHHVTGPVRREPRGLRWIPLTSQANYVYYIDMDPPPDGDVGQIILYIVDEAKVVRVNRSFRERLLHLAIRLNLGMYVYSERIGCLVTVKDRADELERDGLKSPEEREEYHRLRAIEHTLTVHKPDEI